MTLLEYVNCNLCGGSDGATLPAYYLFQGHRLELVRCRGCSLVYLNPRPNAGARKQLYAFSYFEKDWDCGCSGQSYLASRERLIAQAKTGTLNRLKKLGPAGRILDVGCAGGHFLAAAGGEGWEPWGIEICGEMAVLAAAQAGVRVLTLELADCPFPDCFFNAVHMGDVLEHLADPLGTLREAWRILRPGGVVVVHAPVSYAKLKPGDRAGVIPGLPYHIYEFDAVTLRAMLEKAGFTIIEEAVDWLPDTPPEKRTAANIERLSFYARKPTLRGS